MSLFDISRECLKIESYGLLNLKLPEKVLVPPKLNLSLICLQDMLIYLKTQHEMMCEIIYVKYHNYFIFSMLWSKSDFESCEEVARSISWTSFI